MKYLVVKALDNGVSRKLEGLMGTVNDSNIISIAEFIVKSGFASDIELVKVDLDYDERDKEYFSTFGLCKPVVCYKEITMYEPEYYYVVELG